ncbi:MAG TPA: alcohol dehydrogenase catalytic domain-containing protein, partial [Pyrinomonadaceae bacterium]|nr:alcohol dehydrogenase catalytic domain-containing protein [Pyrinomonadaceae bacterium]
MRAIVYSHGASADVLKLEEIDKPLPADDEVLIKIRAAALNPLDYHFLRHTFVRRIMAQLSKVKILKPGRDVAGEVEAVGRNVTQFKA